MSRVFTLTPEYSCDIVRRTIDTLNIEHQCCSDFLQLFIEITRSTKDDVKVIIEAPRTADFRMKWDDIIELLQNRFKIPIETILLLITCNSHTYYREQRKKDPEGPFKVLNHAEKLGITYEFCFDENDYTNAIIDFTLPKQLHNK